MRGKARRKLYLIGMDSTPLWVIERLKGEKGMEAFSRFISKGRIVDMESTLPPITGPAWPSIYTGLPPALHGIPDFFAIRRDYSQELVLYDSSIHPPFWKRLAASGYRCLVVTPATDTKLPDYKNVDMITGFPLEPKVSDAGLKSFIERHGFVGEPEVERGIKNGTMSIEEAAKELEKSTASRAAIAKELIDTNSYDFVFVCFTETDRLQHFVMSKRNYAGYILPVYRAIASFLAYVLARAEKEGAAVILVSDHGMQPINSKFLINSYLANEGYLTLQESAQETVDALAKSKGDRHARVHILDYDMGLTQAFAAVAYDPVTTIWINDSRFKGGIVGKRERSKVKADLIASLWRARSREGDAMFVDVIDADSYYGVKPRAFIAPDIFVEAKKGYTLDIFNFSMDSLFLEPEAPKSGDHLRHGIFGFYPRSLGIDPNGMSVLGVAPTILTYFGLAPEKGMRGNSRLRG